MNFKHFFVYFFGVAFFYIILPGFETTLRNARAISLSLILDSIIIQIAIMQMSVMNKITICKMVRKYFGILFAICDDL